MGIINQGILGGVSGTVGTVVGGSWKGINYLRGKAGKYKDANSAMQIGHRAKFSACVALAKAMMDNIIHRIWDRKAVKMSGYNLFVKTNLPMFDVNGDIPNYGKLTFSLGDLRLPDNLSVQDDVETPGGIAITWANNAGVGNAQASDRLRVLAMSEDEVSVLEGLNITRDAEAANILLPFGAGVEAQVYLFFENEANTSFSASVHTTVALS